MSPCRLDMVAQVRKVYTLFRDQAEPVLNHSVANLYPEVSDSFKAYAASGHRHLPEIEQGLADMAGSAVGLTFVPHLLPINRGIHTTLYANLTDTEVDVQALYDQCYASEPFVDVLPAGSHPETRSVRGSNYCRISVHRPGNGKKVVVLVVEDNLTKGASGQAVQCMNIMFGLPENNGLSMPGIKGKQYNKSVKHVNKIIENEQ